MAQNEVLEATLKTMATFGSNVTTLSNTNQGSQPIKQDWQTVRGLLEQHALPKLGPSVRFAARSSLATISTSLHALDLTHEQQFQNLRAIWIANIQGQLTELENLIKNPPPDAPTFSTTSAPQRDGYESRIDDLAEAKALLAAGAQDAEKRASEQRDAGKGALLLACVLCVGAVCVPLTLSPGGTGWALVAQWGTRLLMVVALMAPALLLIRVASEQYIRSVSTTRERSLLQVLAASAYVTSSTDHGAALVEFVRNLSQPEKPAPEESSLVLPATLIKELPAILQAFKNGAK